MTDPAIPPETPAAAATDAEAPTAEPRTTNGDAARTAPLPPTGIGGLVADFAAMVRFYSRLPLPRLATADDPIAPPPFGRAIRMLPFASLVIAAPAALVATLLAPTDLPGAAVAALAVAVAAVVTGGFHEDGLADVADGFGGGATAERRLEIMKDSRIGAFGGLALAAQFVLRTALVAEAIDRYDGPATGLAMLAVAALARVLPLMLMVALPPARVDGLGRAAGRPEPGALVPALLGAAVIGWYGLAPIADGPELLAAATTAVAALLGLGLMAKAKIGGFTGDVIGAGTIVTEVALLTGLLA